MKATLSFGTRHRYHPSKAITIAASCFDCVLVRGGFELLLGRPLEKIDSKRVRNDGLAGKHVDSPLPLFLYRIAVIE